MATRTGARPGRVSRVTAGRVYVELADSAPGFEFGPVLDTVGGLVVDDKVIVTALARDPDELVVIGVLGGRDGGAGGGVTPEELEVALEPYATDVDLTAMGEAIGLLLADKATLAQLADKAPLTHQHHADDVSTGILALERLPVAPSGNNNPTQIVRADDARLSDTRAPTAHNHDAAAITSGTLALARVPTGPAGVPDAAGLPVKLRATVALVTHWATLTGTPTLDAYTTQPGDTVLLTAQTTGSQNGLWLIPAGGGAWVRRADADATVELAGAMVVVERGLNQGGKLYKTTWNAHTANLGTTAQVWRELVDTADARLATAALTNVTPAAGVTFSPYGTPSSAEKVSGMVTLRIEIRCDAAFAPGVTMFTVAAGLRPRAHRVWINVGSVFAAHRNYQLELSTGGVCAPQHAIPATEVLLGSASYLAA